MIYSDAYIKELRKYPREERVSEGLIGYERRDLTEQEDSALDELIADARELESDLRLRLMPSRETSLALTKLEEAMMWASRSIRNNGVIA